MGLLGDAIGAVVLRYKVEADDAIKNVKNLSKEQQKAARDTGKALQEQGKEVQSLGEKYAKGAAVIAGAYMLAKSGLEAMRTESKLSAGAVGIDLDKLGEAAGGLRTRWELMTIAQAGSQGAWKLNTAQIGLVIEGMRALEKKGFEQVDVTNKITDALKKGKLEGLDDFGISLKTTGNATEDLRALMKALGQATRDVGGDLSKAGDDAERAAVKFANARDKVASNIGKGIDKGIWAVEWVGKGAAIVFGAEDDREQIDVLDLEHRAEVKFWRDWRRKRKAQLEETEGEVKQAELEAAFGPSRTSDYAKEIESQQKAAASALKRAADAAKRAREERERLLEELMGRAGETTSITSFDGDIAAMEAARRAEADRAYSLSAEKLASNALGDAQILASISAWEEQHKAGLAEAGGAEQKSFLAKVFGPIDEFDLYTEALTTLGSTTQNVMVAIYDAVASGSEITGKMLRKAFGDEIAAAGKRLLAYGISAELTGAIKLATGNPAGAAEMAAGAAAIAGSFVVAKIANAVGGGSGGGGGAGGYGGAGGGARDASQDHRAGGGGGGGGDGNSKIVVMGDGWALDSPRHRAANLVALQTVADSYTAARPGNIRRG